MRADNDVNQFVHPEALAWLMAELDEAEMKEFAAGVKDLCHQLVDALFDSSEAALAEWGYALAAYVESWRLSVVMANNPEWQSQMEFTEKMLANDAGALRTTDELRSSVG